MAEEDLIPMNERPMSERRRIGRMGGLVTSERKRLANMTKNIKHGRYALKTSEALAELSRNPEKSAELSFGILNSLLEKFESLPTSLQIKIGHLATRIHQAVFPSKVMALNLEANTENIADAIKKAHDERKDKEVLEDAK